MSGCYVCRKISITEDDYLDWYDEYFCTDGEKRRLHTMVVAKRFELNLTEVKIMSYLKNNQIERNLNEILECSLIGETSLCRAINHLEEREFIKKALNPQNRRYLQLDFFGEGRFVASYIEMEQKKFISEIFEGFTREERVLFGRMLWKINFNIQSRIQKSLTTKNKW